MKYLLWIAIIVFVLLLLRRAQGARARRQPPRAPETMVGCAYCGVNQPRSESLLVGGRYYCCPAHERAAREDND